MTTALILIVSGVLIGAGASILWRDLQRKNRSAFVSDRDGRLGIDPEIEITISHRAEPRASAPLETGVTPRDGQREPVPANVAPFKAVSPPVAINADKLTNGARPSLEQQWSSLQATISGGIDKINAVLAPVRLSVAASGEPSWSYKNRGYGAHRRVLLAGESVAWLRLEIDAEGQMHASLKVHKEDLAEINAAAAVPVENLNAARVSDLLSQCLKPAATYALRQNGHRSGDEEASAQAWQTVDPLVIAALKATNGALAQAGARLVPLAPAAWESELRRHRMTLSIDVNGGDVARMHIERLAHEMEVAVGVREPNLIHLGRRRRIPVEGMTIHTLAELIAGCAWPTIARFREIRPPA